MQESVNNPYEVFYEYHGTGGQDHNPFFLLLQKIYGLLILQLCFVGVVIYFTADFIDTKLHDFQLYFRISFYVIMIISCIILRTKGDKVRNGWLKYLFFIVRTIAVLLFFISGPDSNTDLAILIFNMTLYLQFIFFIFLMTREYKRRRARLCVILWLCVSMKVAYSLKDNIEGFHDKLNDLLAYVVQLSVFGLYLANQTNFILQGVKYQINCNECMFGSFVLQFEFIESIRRLTRRCLPQAARTDDN